MFNRRFPAILISHFLIFDILVVATECVRSDHSFATTTVFLNRVHIPDNRPADEILHGLEVQQINFLMLPANAMYYILFRIFWNGH